MKSRGIEGGWRPAITNARKAHPLRSVAVRNRLREAVRERKLIGRANDVAAWPIQGWGNALRLSPRGNLGH